MKYIVCLQYTVCDAYRVSFPVDSVAKVFHLGNSAAGKSSLAKVLFEHTCHASEHKFIAVKMFPE